MALRTLKVFPNPFKRYDHEGRPVGIVAYEPEGDGVRTFDTRKFVGAILVAEIKEKFPEGDARQAAQENTFKYSDEPVTLPDTAYYRDALVRGELIAADSETARKIGRPFIDPAKALLAAREGAIHRWEQIEKHEDTPEKAPDCLRNFAFGPMPKPEKADEKKPEGETKKAETPKGGK